MNNIFFSIIIPTYNRDVMLYNSVISVIKQTFIYFEVIIIDDGSEDNTFGIAKELCEKDLRVRYYFQNNSERAVARNNGATKANGDFLIFLDSDDFFSGADHLKSIYEFIRKNNFTEGLYFTGATVKDGVKLKLTRDYIQDEVKQIDFFINESVIPARVCLSRSIFKYFKFDKDCIIVEDTVLWSAITENFPVFYIPIHSVTYLLHEDNSINIKKSNVYFKRLKGLKKMFKHYNVGKKISVETKKKHLNRCYLGVSDFYKFNNKFFLSKYWLLISLLRFPTKEFKHKIKNLFLC
jgi:glycosyltransferase involved in cell wall biosynthesis